VGFLIKPIVVLLQRPDEERRRRWRLLSLDILK
jgi:hypothetical protein